MKKIAGLIVIFIALGSVLVYANEKDDWSFELAKAISEIESAVNLIEKYKWSISTSGLDRKIKTYTDLMEVGLEKLYITKEQYEQKIESVNAVKRRMLQVIGDRSEGLGL
jgi:hypothetical protein